MVNDNIDTFAFEIFIRRYRDGDIKVGVTDAGAIIGPGRDFDGILFALMDNIFGDAVDRLDKINLDLIVRLGRTTTKGRGAAKKTFKDIEGVGSAAKNIFKTSAALIGIGVGEWSAGTSSERIPTGGSTPGSPGNTGVAELIVHFSFFTVTQNFVGGADFLEFLGGASFFVAVGVILEGKLPVGRFNLCFGGRFTKT